MAGIAGRVALVTGGGRGFGRVAGELLAARGERLMCSDLSEQELQAVGLECVAADLEIPTAARTQ